MRIIKGPLPPSVFYSTAKNSEEVSSQVKVKRKCGRPRNPIPRHKRESHINAEHRRRGKIQDGFRTLKSIVPKYEHTSGRDSKADILFKAVDYCKLLQNDIKELGSSIELLKAEKDALSADIKSYKTLVPDLSLYEEPPMSLDDRYTEYVQYKTKDNWTFGTFKVIMRPLFESYKLSVRGDSVGEFLRSVADWATSSLSLSNLRTICLTTLRDDPVALESPRGFKDGPAIRSYRVPLPTDNLNDNNNNNNTSNNNHCLNTSDLTPELLGCQSVTVSPAWNGWVRTGDLDVHGYGFDRSRATPKRSPPMIKGGPCLNQQYSEDRLPVMGSHLGNSSFLENFYFNSSNDLQQQHLQQQLHMTKTSIPHWPNLHFRQQHGHYYQSNHLIPSRNFLDLRDSHPFVGSPHQQLPQHMVVDPLGSSPYSQPPYSPSDRDFRYDLASPREGIEALPVPISYLGQSSNFRHHGRPKRLSQSSSEGEGSLLNMDMFVKKVAETLADNDKYPQLSPSTDSCVSSGSSAYIPSPGVLSGRNSDYPCSYRSTPSLGSFKHNKSVAADNGDRQMSVPSPTYKNIVGADPYKNCVNKLHTQQKNCVNSYDSSMASILGVSSSKIVPTTGCRQPSLGSHESSSLLAEMLKQRQSTMLQEWSAHHGVDNMSASPTHLMHIASNTLPAPSFNASKVTDSSVNEQVKQENAYVLPSLSTLPSPDISRTGASDQHLSLPTNEQAETSENFHINETPTHDLASNISNPGISCSFWPSSPPKSNITSSQPEACIKSQLAQLNEIPNGSENQTCFFKMAHQNLLKTHFCSIKKDGATGIQPPDLPHNETNTPKPESDIFVCRTYSGYNIQNPVPAGTNNGAFLEQSSENVLPPHSYSRSMASTSRHKIGKKTSLEDGSYSGEGQLEAVSACKKSCPWPGQSQTSPTLTSPQQYLTSEPVTGV